MAGEKSELRRGIEHGIELALRHSAETDPGKLDAVHLSDKRELEAESFCPPKPTGS
jgi:hypothetical protein